MVLWNGPSLRDAVQADWMSAAQDCKLLLLCLPDYLMALATFQLAAVANGFMSSSCCGIMWVQYALITVLHNTFIIPAFFPYESPVCLPETQLKMTYCKSKTSGTRLSIH